MHKHPVLNLVFASISLYIWCKINVNLRAQAVAIYFLCVSYWCVKEADGVVCGSCLIRVLEHFLVIVLLLCTWFSDDAM